MASVQKEAIRIGVTKPTRSKIIFFDRLKIGLGGQEIVLSVRICIAFNVNIDTIILFIILSNISTRTNNLGSS